MSVVKYLVCLLSLVPLLARASTMLLDDGGQTPYFGSINLGHASDTTLSRSAAGTLAVEGANVAMASDITPDIIWFASSDESTALTTGTAKLSLILPQAFSIDTSTDSGIGCSVVTAPTTSGITVDVNEEGTTIMTTNKISIDATEDNSQDAATAPGVTDTSLAKGALITVDVDAIGSGTAGAGLKCWLIGAWQ